MTDSPSSGPAAAPPIPPSEGSPSWQPATPPPVPPVPPMPPQYSRRPGIGFGVLLVFVGLAIMASWFIPGLAWWSLWPLLFVVGGFVQIFTPGHQGKPWGVGRVFDGIGTMLFGVVLLGCTTGYVSWSMWWVLLTLWPVFIIAAGFAIIGAGLHQTWLRGIGSLVIWVAVLYAASVSLTGLGGLQPAVFVAAPIGQAFSYSQPVDGITSATLNLEGGAGDITMGSGTELVNATGTSQFGQPTFAVVRNGDSADVRIGLSSKDGTVVWPGTLAGRLNVRLSDTALWDATLSTGASNLDADLSNVRISRLTLKSGASSSTVRLGEVPEGTSRAEVSVKSGVSSVTIYVPRDAEARVDTHNGLTTTSVDGRLVRQSSGVWQTPGYSSASKTWNISIESGVSTVSIRTY